MRLRWVVLATIAMIYMLSINGQISAHANLLRSSPSANEILDSPPSEIRLWFTEPLEGQFSHFRLHDIDGEVVSTPSSQIDGSDPTQLLMQPGDLPDGLYTIIWGVVSSADGHRTEGSLNFTIGEPIAGYEALNRTTSDSIPLDSAIIRWLNLLAMGILVGTLGFMLFVWFPAEISNRPDIEKRLRTLVFIGWILVGISSFLMLFLQVSISADTTLFEAITQSAVKSVLADTRFGFIWLGRMGMWVILGIALLLTTSKRWFYWGGFVLGVGILLTHSLNSHASAAEVSLLAVANDWIHLFAASLWIGGLIQFVTLIPVLKKLISTLDSFVRLTMYFSNYGRILVFTLAVSGFYAGWLEVGAIRGLFKTQYGNVLLLKLILILPLLAIAGINFIFTRRRLNNGEGKWVRHLRQLITIEIVLLIGIFAAVGVMTAISPARNELAFQDAQPQPPLPAPIVEEKMVDGLTIGLEISPGWVGENTFSLTIIDRSGNPVENASLIRLRFENRTENIGESELRPEHQGNGVYKITGSNISSVGEWRVRTTIQRPSEFDTVVDFASQVDPAPLPLAAPTPDISIAVSEQRLIHFLLGFMALISGGWFLASHRRRLVNHLPATALTGVGIIFLITAILPATSMDADKILAADSLPVKLVVASDRELPYLITENGGLLRPNADNQWQLMPFESSVNDLYVDVRKDMWVATDLGVYQYDDGVWINSNDLPSKKLVTTHGYLYAMGDEGIVRGVEHWRDLSPPSVEQSMDELVMLNDHSHVLQSGDYLFRTIDLGLTWETVDIPDAIVEIWTDQDEKFFAMTESGIYTWDRKEWVFVLPLPEGSMSNIVRSFRGRFYAIVEGQLYRQENDQWELIHLSENVSSSLVSLAVQGRTERLWILDSDNLKLWVSANGETWESISIRIDSTS